MIKTPIRMAVVGCGYWGMNHVRVIAESPETELVAVCDRNPDRLGELKRRYPSVLVFADVETMLQEADIEAAVVATNAIHHYEVTHPLIEAGKHVLVEKPLTTEVDDALRLVQAAETANVKLMVGHIFLFNTCVEKVKSYMTNGQFGELHYLYARRTNLGPIRDDVNALWDLATHDISVFNYLLDTMPQWVSAVGASVLHNCRQDIGFIVLGYPNEVLGHIHVSWADPHKVRELVVVGSNQRIAFNDLDPLEKVRVFEKGVGAVRQEPTNFGEFAFSIRDGDIITPHFKVTEPLKSQLQHFVDCVVNDHRPLSDGMTGVRVVQVMHAIDQSVAQHGAPVTLNELPVGTEKSWALT